MSNKHIINNNIEYFELADKLDKLKELMGNDAETENKYRDYSACYFIYVFNVLKIMSGSEDIAEDYNCGHECPYDISKVFDEIKKFEPIIIKYDVSILFTLGMFYNKRDVESSRKYFASYLRHETGPIGRKIKILCQFYEKHNMRFREHDRARMASEWRAIPIKYKPGELPKILKK
jgi:hypothetical protein